MSILKALIYSLKALMSFVSLLKQNSGIFNMSAGISPAVAIFCSF